ncbi:MAG TPA: MFS transporter [Chloroflexota bacterium]|nr:MFS transporter [Chloroflexota bacterium]
MEPLAAGSPSRQAWLAVAVAGFTTTAALGTRGAFGVLLVPVAEAFGWPRGLVAGAIAVNALLWAASAAPWGVLLDRRGPRWAFGLAAALAAAGLLVAAHTTAPWELYLGMGVLVGIGLAPLQVNSQGVVVAHWFARRRGVALGIVAAGAGLGVLTFAPLTQAVLDAAGWRAAFGVLAAVFLVAVLPLNALAQRRAPSPAPMAAPLAREAREHALARRPLATRLPPAPSRAAGPTVRLALRHPRFWLLAAGYLVGAVPVALLLAHGVACLLDAGFAPSVAAGAFGLSGGCAVVAMLGLGWLADRCSGEWAYTMGSAAIVLGCAVLLAAAPGREGLVVLYALLFAVGWASRQGLHAFMGAAIGQGRSLGALMGLLAAHIAAGSALGPALGGWAFDATGSYRLALLLGAACAAVATGCIWLAAPRRGVLVAALPPPAPSTGCHRATSRPDAVGEH